MPGNEDRRPRREAATGDAVDGLRVTRLTDIESRFAALDHLVRLGLGSELVEHALFAEAICCFCTRCRYEDQDNTR